MPQPERLPDLGLPLYGSRSWHLGARVLSFDVTPLGTLELRVEDRLLRRFPTGAAGDDSELLRIAQEEWSALRPLAQKTVKQARAILQEAMNSGHTWTRAAFEEEIHAHPLMRRLASRLVWAGLDHAHQPQCFGRLMLHGEWDLGPASPPRLPEHVIALQLPQATMLPEPVRASWTARFSAQPLPQLLSP